MFSFEIEKKSKKSRARVGIIHTPHGVIHTPAFIPVATQATVKGITRRQLEEIGIEAVLSNTYHLYLRPGDKVVKKLGGLHGFMNWNKPVFTDSGGFQVFSLGASIEHKIGKVADSSAVRKKKKKDEGESEHTNIYQSDKFVKITEEGVQFRSHLDGSSHFIGPEESMKIQENLGADIIFTFDECTSPMHDYQYVKKSMERTHRWAKRSIRSHQRKDQALFGIVQGGDFKDLRAISAKFIGKQDFPGFGIGGSFGKPEKVLDWTLPLLPVGKPRHFLGIGLVPDILASVKRGIDTFDCVVPTRLGRNGTALTKEGNLNVRAAQFKLDKNPIEKNCGCYTCQNFSRYYLCHLFKANEMLGPILTTIHNLWFMEHLMRKIREDIMRGKL